MVRTHHLALALLGFGAVAEARRQQQHAAVADHVLSKSMAESLSKIAAPYLDESDIGAMIDLTAPKDQMITQIDAMQKQIIAECNRESTTFTTWLASKQSDLVTNQQQLDALVVRQTQLKQRVDLLKGQIIGSQTDGNDIDTKLAQARANQASYVQQLADATALRAKTRTQNLAIIQQHKDALQALADLRALVAALHTDSDEVMATLKRVAVLKKTNRKVGALIDSVKAQLAQGQSADPIVKKDLQQKLLAMIDQIVSGVKESLALYADQETVQQQKFDNEIRPGLQMLIDQAQAQIAALEAKKAQVQGNIGSLSTDLAQAQTDLDQVTTQVQTLTALITSIKSQIDSGVSSHSSKQARCKTDLDSLEVIRQYIVSHISGMTPGNNCNPQSPTCSRCLYNDHCTNGLICTDQGTCGVAPTTAPPKVNYYQLLPKTPPTPWQTGRRVDVNVVPQSAYALADFTYVFKYQQLQPANGWANLFNVLDVADGWPFPNQAALFLTGTMFEIDICQDGLAWPNSYWYRNFNLEKVELNTWVSLAFVVSSSTKTLTLTFRDGAGKVRTQSYLDFHGKPSKFANTGAWVNGRGYASLNANFADFRRYDSALSANDVLAVFGEFFP